MILVVAKYVGLSMPFHFYLSVRVYILENYCLSETLFEISNENPTGPDFLFSLELDNELHNRDFRKSVFERNTSIRLYF